MEKIVEKKYILLDLILNKPYVNEYRESFLFLDEFEAKKARNDLKDVKLLNVSSRGLKDIQSISYAAGANYFIIVDKDGNRNKEDLYVHELNRQYYNSDLNAYLGLQVRHKDKQSISKLANCVFIMAVSIDKNRDEYMVYASARNKSGKQVLLAFSELKEFDRWREKHGKKYKPLEVDFLGLQRLGGFHGFLVNPESSKFYLSPEFIKAVQKAAKEEKQKEKEKK